VVGGLVAALRIFKVILVFIVMSWEGKGLVKLKAYFVARVAVQGVVAGIEPLMPSSQLLLAIAILKLMMVGKYTIINPPLGTGLFRMNEKE
jgi:hypothetical protein